MKKECNHNWKIIGGAEGLYMYECEHCKEVMSSDTEGDVWLAITAIIILGIISYIFKMIILWNLN